MPKGDIGSIIETKDIVSNNLTVTYNCIKLSDGYYMMAFKDNDSDGHIATFALTESDGNIGSTISDWEFLGGDTVNSVKLIKISGTTYAIIYAASQTINEWRVRTFTVSNVGVITESFIENLTIPTTNDEPEGRIVDIINISGDIYAIVFTESGASKPGVVVTVDIDSSGVIGNTVIDSLDFASTSKGSVSIVRVGTTDYWAIAFTDNNSDPVVVTVDINSVGTIAGAVTDTQVLASITCITANILRVPGTDYYAVVVARAGTAGTIYTCSINSSGAITNGSNGNFDAADAEVPYMISLGSDAFMITYRGVDNDGFLVSITIDTDGTVGSIIKSLEFRTTDVLTPFVIYLGYGNYAITYGAQAQDDVQCATVGVVTGAVFPTDPITRVTSLIHRFNRGTYTLELNLGEVVSDFGIPGVEPLPRRALTTEEEEIMRVMDDVRSYGTITVPPQFQPTPPKPIGLGPLGRAAREEQLFVAPERPAPKPTVSERATQFTFPGFTAPAQPTISDKVTEQRPVTLVQPGILDDIMERFRQRRRLKKARPVSIEESKAKFGRLREEARRGKPIGISEEIRNLMRFR